MTEDQSAVVTLKVRVTPEFREKIVSTAKANNRSMNQEIVARLEQSFDEPMKFNPSDAEAVTKLVAKSMQELLLALSNQGVDGEQILSALREISGNKKAPFRTLN